MARVIGRTRIPAEPSDGGRELRFSRTSRTPFVIRLLVNAAALWVATQVVPGVTYDGGWLPFLGLAFVFGVINATIRPLTKLLTLPFIILTLGLFALVVNGLMLMLTSAVSSRLGIGFYVDGFWSAFFGALVVSVVSTVLSFAVGRPSRWEAER